MSIDSHQEVSRETRDRLAQLVSLVGRWNPVIRLVSKADPVDVWERHVMDSLQLAQLIDITDEAAADVGAGAGFPGLVLAIALDRHFYLIESDLRKAAFLSEAARLTGANVTVVPYRVQSMPVRCRLVTARAFAAVSQTLDAVFGMLTDNAICLLPKGRNVEAELERAAVSWRMQVERFPSRTDPAATILRLTDISRV